MEHKSAHRAAEWVLLAALLYLFLLPFPPPSYGESSLPKVRPSLSPLDLSRVPSTEEIMAAGQLGGQLYPTEDMDLGGGQAKRKAMAGSTPDDRRRIERSRAINLSFGEAIQKWNRHEYREAVTLLRKHAEQYPESPWASEAILHVGCDATYYGRYAEAEESFNRVLDLNKGKSHEGAKKLVNKTRLRLAALKVSQNKLDESRQLFGELLNQSDDWRERTYASHWLQRLSRYSGNKLSMLNCGALALARVLERDGRQVEAREVSGLLPTSEMGHSIKDLTDIAADYGYEFVGLKLSIEEIPKAPLPAIVQIPGGEKGDSGHYWVLEKRENSMLELFDPQSGRKFTQSVDELNREWNGNILVLQRGGDTPLMIGELMTESEMEAHYGGCCGAPPPPSDLGDPGGDDCPNCCHGPGCKKSEGDEKDRDKRKEKDPCGSPVWSVNMISMNLFVQDTPLWFVNPIGPPIEITLSYNSQSSIVYNEPFGNKWIFNYSSYLIVDTGGQVTIFMPDGRHDLYTPAGDGTYSKPTGVFNTLTKIDENHYKLKFPDDSVYEYDIPYGTNSLQPFLVRIQDRYGESLNINYESHNTAVRIKHITDALGRPTFFAYDHPYDGGLVTAVADPTGRTAKFDYDQNKNLTQITDMGGHSTSFTYDPDVYLTSIGNSQGTWSFYVEPADGIVANSDNYPPPGDFMWANYRITVTDPSGGREEYMYYAGCDRDEAGCAGRSWHVSPSNYVEWQSQTFNNWRLKAPMTKYFFTQVNGRKGRISTVLYPDGGTLRYTYDNVTGKPATITDGHGHTKSYTYNRLGLKTSFTDANEMTTEMTYADNFLDLIGITNGLGTRTMSFDQFHNVTSVTDYMGNSTSFTYDAYGRITSFTNPSGTVVESTYYAATDDHQKHQLKEIASNGKSLFSFTYDHAGRVKTRTDDSGLTLTFDYDHLDRVTSIAYPDGKYESFAYSDCCPRLLARHTDRAGRTTQYSYDALDRLTQIRNPDDTLTGYRYDPNGNLVKLFDKNGNITTFSYDSMNRMTKKTYADGNEETFEYDDADLPTSRTTARGITTTYAYDQNHNVTSITYSDGTPSVEYAYDAHNRVISRTDGIGSHAFAYDANSRIVSIDGPWENDTVSYGYDPIGRIVSIQQQGGETISHTYDALARLSEITSGGRRFVYSYSPTTASPIPVALSRPNGSLTAYQRDGLNRLTAITNKKGSQEIISANAFTYNPLDLLGSETITNGNPITSFTNNLVTFYYNAANQLLSSNPPDNVFAYDKDGNMTRGYTPEGSAFTATYDGENRLKSLDYTDGASLGHHIDYHYSGNGVLSKQVVDGVETRYVRDGHHVLQERNGANSVTRSYVWGLGMGGGVGGVLELGQGGQRYNYLYDGRGNVSALIDNAQNVVAGYTYDGFGNLMSRTGGVDQPYRFSTKPYDEKTGLSYFGYRFYSPHISRWITRDPAGETGGMNLYGFSNSNPVSYIDPEGRHPVLIVIGILAAGYLAYQAYDAITDWWRSHECAKQANIEEQRRFGKPDSYMEYQRYTNRDRALMDNAIKGFNVGLNVPGTSFTGPAPMSAGDAIFGAAADIAQKPVTGTLPVLMENYR